MMTHELNARFTSALVCSACRGPLLLKDNFLWSADCGHRFPVVEGIPIFGQLDEFYEGKNTEVNCSDRSFESRTLDVVHRLLLRIEKSVSVGYVGRRLKFFEHYLQGADRRILDVGCGLGWGVFLRFGEVFGIDLSLRSLHSAQALGYHMVAQGNILDPPFFLAHLQIGPILRDVGG